MNTARLTSITPMKTRQSGQMLIEALVAIGVMMVGMMAVFGTLSESLSLNRVAADQYIAANLASEGIEIIKNLVDSEYKTPNCPFGRSIDPNAFSKRCAIDMDTESACSTDYQGWYCRGTTGGNFPTLKFNNDTGFYSLSGGVSTKFKRYVEISMHPGCVVYATSTVEWAIKGGKISTITVADHLYNWRRSCS